MPYPKILAKASKSQNEIGDCTVIATCVATGLSYDEVHKAFTRAGRRRRRGCTTSVVSKALSILGYKHESVKKWKGKTFTSITLPRDSCYIIYSVDHAAGVKFGLVKDWASEKRLRVTEVWKISRK